LSISQQIYLAPFQGITTYTYREVYTKYFTGVDKLFTPFFTGNQKVNSLNKRAFEFNYPTQNNVEVVPQMLSKDTDELIRFANFCDKKGFKEINWNLGCPYPRVANKKRGSGMLPYPELVNEILSEVMKETDIRFSIKCRLGYFSPEEIIDLMQVFNTNDIYELTIHARIGKQLYTGDVMLGEFRKALLASRIPIIYNGDIFSGANFEKIVEKLPEIDTWMIGRGLLVDPFLPSKITGIDVPDINSQKEIAYKFMTDLYLAYRKKSNDRLQAISVMKELWKTISYSFSNPQKIFNRIKKTTSFDDYEQVVADVFHQFEWLVSDAELYRNRG